ncbi:MAG TPA: PH domain-containing protein [Rhizomicrobium sp.]|nr:PH domain-containing protein [Rhizomicrobium sp.]
MQPDDIAGRLLSGEKIIWTGRPRQGLLLTSRDALLVPFSILWGGFAIFWEYSVLFLVRPHRSAAAHAPPAIIFPLFGAGFVLVGLFLMFGRFLLDAQLRKGTIYAVTDQRVLILRSGPMNKFVSLSLDRLPGITLSEGRNGCGTITFGDSGSNWARPGFQIWVPALDAVPRFLNIENARAVFDQIQRLVRPVAKSG